eukprot:scaffold29197_cov73-Isochrysis_galbana.AAC.1
MYVREELGLRVGGNRVHLCGSAGARGGEGAAAAAVPTCVQQRRLGAVNDVVNEVRWEQHRGHSLEHGGSQH